MLNKPNLSGLPRIKHAFFNSIKGLVAVWKTEEAFRQEVILVLPLIMLVSWLDITVVERLMLIASLIVILIAELVNTAFEYVVDRISTDFHPISGSIKDIGSAVVLICIAFAIIIWGVVLWA